MKKFKKLILIELIMELFVVYSKIDGGFVGCLTKALDYYNLGIINVKKFHSDDKFVPLVL
jgi:hypothetical protein